MARFMRDRCVATAAPTNFNPRFGNFKSVVMPLAGLSDKASAIVQLTASGEASAKTSATKLIVVVWLRTARNRMRGRPFKKGESGNRGGRPKVIAELRALARACYGKVQQMVENEDDLSNKTAEELRAEVLADIANMFPDLRLVPAKPRNSLRSQRFAGSVGSRRKMRVTWINPAVHQSVSG
jgi:hypothetical protein